MSLFPVRYRTTTPRRPIRKAGSPLGHISASCRSRAERQRIATIKRAASAQGGGRPLSAAADGNPTTARHALSQLARHRDGQPRRHGRLYAAVDPPTVLNASKPAEILFDE